MAPARLSALDASFLEIESPTAHMHVGWVATFLPPAEGPRPTFDQLRDHVAARIGRAPRYRQRLAPVPFGLGAPRWVDDAAFDVSNHVLHAPAYDLAEVADMAMSVPLCRERPLWELWIADELADGRIGIVGKVHHCLVDGIAAVELAAMLLDPDPDPPAPHPAPWRPSAAPGRLGLLADGVRTLVRTELNALAAPARLVRSPRRLLGLAGEARRAAGTLVDTVDLAPSVPVVNEEISPLRRLSILERPLEDLLRIKRRHEITLNDVVLAVCAGGVRDLFAARDEEPRPLKTMVPVNVRGNGAAGDLGNRIAFIFVDLPCDEADPLVRLMRVHQATSARKRAGQPRVTSAALDALSYTPRPVQQVMAHVAASPRAYNLVISNIPGPRETLYMRGCRLESAHPVIPISDGHGLSIGLNTVGDRACFGIYADRRTIPDADLVAERIDLAIDELLGLGVAAVPA
jgi:diacylglycerol O-acyltransferase / wax synthase